MKKILLLTAVVALSSPVLAEYKNDIEVSYGALNSDHKNRRGENANTKTTIYRAKVANFKDGKVYLEYTNFKIYEGKNKVWTNHTYSIAYAKNIKDIFFYVKYGLSKRKYEKLSANNNNGSVFEGKISKKSFMMELI